MKNAIVVLLAIGLTSGVTGQPADSGKETPLTLMAQVNQGNSYITFPADIGNLEPLWFEGNLIPNFHIRQNRTARLMGVLTPQIILRMYREDSFPVRTPSYLPQITLYYQPKWQPDNRSFALFGRMAHHSNGQDGDFYLNNGEINHLSGDFATNYFEAGFISGRLKPGRQLHRYVRTSLEVHPNLFSSEELRGSFSRYRWHNDLSIFRLPFERKQNRINKAQWSMKVETTWMFDSYNDLSPVSANRLNLKATIFYHPRFLEDIGLFVGFYHGNDYYNIYFDHRIDVLRFGLMTEKLRF